MEKLNGFKRGVNLGGWLSQYKTYDHQHFKSFIKEDDIRRIADWGMDHIRLPIDYEILEDDKKPFEYRSSGYDYIQNCLDWCANNSLNVILDLHRAAGYSFDAAAGVNSLFEDSALQDRLISLWEYLIREFGNSYKKEIVFELLNEILLPSSQPWNVLSHRIHKAIRAINQEAWLMVGGNDMNSVSTLKELELFDDKKTVYTFHCYEPLIYTHQKAYWVEELVAFDKELEYPCEIPELGAFLAKHPPYGRRLGKYERKNLDLQFLRDELIEAREFMDKTGHWLYCGEFGVIENAPKRSRVNWFRDFIKALNELDIGYSAWSYKMMDFGLVDQAGKVVDEEIIKIISGR